MFYLSLRVGKNGRSFYLLKFRTFKKGFDGGLPTASLNDKRLSKVGKWLRRWKLDELPTLWNLIKGDIVLCGCRPDTPEEIASLDNCTRAIVLMRKPGVISPATIWNYREDEILADKNNPHLYYTQVIKPIKYQLNVWYTMNKTLWLDLRIILAYVCRRFISPKKFNIFPKDFNGL